MISSQTVSYSLQAPWPFGAMVISVHLVLSYLRLVSSSGGILLK